MYLILRKFDISGLHTFPPHLYTVATLPWEIQKKSFFNSIIHTYFSLFTLFISEENKLVPAVTVQQYGEWVSQKMEWTAQVAQGKTI